MTMMLRSSIVAAAVVLLVVLSTNVDAAIPGDLITNMPHYSAPIPFKQYSGYITVDATHGRALFYWFVESQRSPSTDPVVMWLNGGPGCSSLDGFFYEHGPFHFDREIDSINTTLHANPFAWNNVSNVLYVEAPAGVGFSYSNTTSDYVTNDNKTATDNYQFLLNWFASYPEYSQNDFYITGESYAGIYVPTLAYTVHQGNQNPKNAKINLKGIMVGNGVTDETFDAVSFTQFAYNHGLYSPNLYAQIQAAGCLTSNSGKCLPLISQMYQQIGNVNIYDIYKQCYNGPPGLARFNYNPLQDSHVARQMRAANAITAEVPCINSADATQYLNDDSVRAAIHALPISKIGRWAICSNKVQYHKLYNSVLGAYQVLTANYRVLFYTGDVDGSVPYVGSMQWLATLENNSKPDNDWAVWYLKNQVAGYFTTYSKPYPITFTTIKGSGHMVPQYKPAQAFAMFSGFLDGTWPPRK